MTPAAAPNSCEMAKAERANPGGAPEGEEAEQQSENADAGDGHPNPPTQRIAASGDPLERGSASANAEAPGSVSDVMGA